MASVRHRRWSVHNVIEQTRGAKGALVAVVLLAAFWVGAHWLGAVGEPAPPEVAPPSAALRKATVPAQDYAIGSGSDLGTGTLDIRLRGVFAGNGNGEAGYAIVNVGAADVAVRVGETLRAGTILAAIHPTHIVVNRAGTFLRVDLDKARRPGAPALASALAPDPPRAVAPAPGIEIEQLASNSSGGVTILAVSPGSELESLGLERGDVVLGLNGQRVSNPEELRDHYVKLARGAPVQVEAVQRGRHVWLNRHAGIH